MRQLRLAVPTCCRCSSFSEKGVVHSFCAPHSAFFENTISLFSYTKLVKTLFAQYKFKSHFQYESVLADLISEYFRYDPFRVLEKSFVKNDRLALIPVPMHRRKLDERGFSPAYELSILFARQLAKKFDCEIEIFDNVVLKMQETAAQSHKNRVQRLLSLQNTFVINSDGISTFLEFHPSKIVIIDDVLTTGATASALIEIIIKNQYIRQLNAHLLLLTFAQSNSTNYSLN